jgi:hypothetical protein
LGAPLIEVVDVNVELEVVVVVVDVVELGPVIILFVVQVEVRGP